ncbi:MAG TPA: PSD1 and planctomycete cytochrome C domain-containing protein [Methylomirabilota bacterium]|nr:PSD1 and planctomycete cytochrome C domain-containing protein [Methylomirabilota bacterium]
MPSPSRVASLLLLAFWSASWLHAAVDNAFFETRIRPVLVEQCYECHSATGKQKGDLRLDTVESTRKGGQTGPAVVPGKPDESLLLKAIRHQVPDMAMPPKKQKLPEQVIKDFEVWILAGAPDPRGSDTGAQPPTDLAAVRQQWAYRPPTPTNLATGGAASSIDQFLNQKLAEKGIDPAPPATKRELIRRATFDLTGLPPTPSEVTAFLQDDSAQAFHKVIDRLLASPHYGERWARHWLDVVRYTDSFDSRGIGGEADVPHAYRYRDWVIKAFNDDLPYDQFVMQQVAGDILAEQEDGTFDTNALIATGMYVLGEWGLGDADKEKMLTDIVDDQIDVTGRAFLGLTLACARCHDHKFDPISTKDYYSLAGIFFSSHILPNPGVKTGGSPTLRVPLASKRAIADRNEKLKQVQTLSEKREQLLDAWVATAKMNLLANLPEILSGAAQGELSPVLANAFTERATSLVGALLPRRVTNLAGHTAVYAWKLADNSDTPSVAVNTSAAAIPINTLTLPGRSISIHPSPKAGVSVVWKSKTSGRFRLRASIHDSDDKCGDGVTWSVTALTAKGNLLHHTNSIANGSKDACEREVQLSSGDNLAITVFPKSGYECDTTTLTAVLEADGAGEVANLAADVIASTPANPVGGKHGSWSFSLPIELSPPDSPLVIWVRSSDRVAKEQAVRKLHDRLTDPSSLTAIEGALLREISEPRSAFWNPVRAAALSVNGDALAEVRALDAQRASLQASIPPAFPVTHAIQEGGTPESAHAGFKDAQIHIRGRYDRLGQTVPRAFPAVLVESQPTIKNGSGRLELARWLASPSNPLTARVMVNRLWLHHFGEGIVRTPNNFGKLGTPPTHPELLDHLALEFINSGWSVKAMHKKLMLTAAYQRSSRPTAQMLAADPDNLLFGRMNRRRLESEAIRDSLLFAAGRLGGRTSGPAVRELNSPERTLFLMTIRSDRATYQTLFDAADSSAIVEKRTESTVAPQALFLMNNPFVQAQSTALAQLVASQEASLEEKLTWLYERLYARPPTTSEVAAITTSLNLHNPQSWPTLCHTLLCANEFIYID